MKILTFGSNVSKLLAEQYILLNGGKLVSSVLANRTDFFNHNFIKNRFDANAYEALATLIENEESTIKETLINQHPDFIGKGSDDHLQAFFNVQPDIDLIIIDNQMDLEESLYYIESPEKSFFLSKHSTNLQTFQLTGELSVEEAIDNTKAVIAYLSLRFPQAKIVFINHPVTNDRNALLKIRKPEIFAQKMARSTTFEQAIKVLNVYSIPNLEVTRPYQTRDDRFFSVHQYCAFAGMLFNYVKLT